jgi:hypothetical protein
MTGIENPHRESGMWRTGAGGAGLQLNRPPPALQDVSARVVRRWVMGTWMVVQCAACSFTAA